MFKALLLAVWYDLSDVKLAEALEDRASFRRFCGFSGTERPAFVRLRQALTVRTGSNTVRDGRRRAEGQVDHGESGTLVDATIIASASEPDDDARCVKHRMRPAVHGFKAHVGADASTPLVERVWITPANVHDGRAGPAALPDDPGEVFADSAYRGSHFGTAVKAKGGIPRVVATAVWARDQEEANAKLEAWNGPIHRVRARIEKIFETWKRGNEAASVAAKVAAIPAASPSCSR